MQFYTGQHQYYCGIDLHARTMYVCILDSNGVIVAHRNMASALEPFLIFIAPTLTLHIAIRPALYRTQTALSLGH
jgi:hypothetical protein